MKAEEIVQNSEKACLELFKKQEEIAFYNSQKVLNAFHKECVSENSFSYTTGYGYNDEGRDIVEKVYADVFKAEDSLVRAQLISGTHALTVTLFALLRPNDTLLSICGKPYDTLDEVIGIVPNPSSLQSYQVKYAEIALVNNDFDYPQIKAYLNKHPVKVIEIQRSIGYSTRNTITIEQIKKVCAFIKQINPEIIIMVDNCYCEFVGKEEPIEVGADICVGSLIKNLGAGIAKTGAYIVGRHDLIALCGERLTAPGEGKDIGPSLDNNKYFLQGLYMAPSAVCSAIKTAILLSKAMSDLKIKVEPAYNDLRSDIVEKVIFNDADKMIKFIQSIQASSAIDSFAVPVPWDMPGYKDQVIMASGSFAQGSSIEISCDGPMRLPYIAYFQGSLTYEYGKIAVINAIKKILEN
jgi:cystathionine beta-lyase family protein involved in aluminum resistance